MVDDSNECSIYIRIADITTSCWKIMMQAGFNEDIFEQAILGDALTMI